MKKTKISHRVCIQIPNRLEKPDQRTQTSDDSQRYNEETSEVFERH